MSFETIVFKVNGNTLLHEGVSLDASAENPVRTASFDVIPIGDGLPCEIDDEAEVYISGELWGTGFVRDINPSHDEDERSYDVSFVSKTCDATECSIDHETGLAVNVDLKEVAETFDELGIGIESDIKTLKKTVHKVRPGETLFETLELDAKSQGVLIHDTPEGKLKLSDKPEGRHAGTLKRGVNIKAASGSLSGAKNFSEIKVRGQTSEGVENGSMRPEAIAKGTAKRKRPLIKLNDGQATSDRLKKRADWEARRAAGQMTGCTITVSGMRDEAGKLWTRNYLIEVDDDWLGIQQDMVIASTSMKQDDDEGTTTILTLKDPRALGGKNPRGKSSKDWSAPSNSKVEYSAPAPVEWIDP